jgi:superfamily II DNA or RNA helicase
MSLSALNIHSEYRSFRDNIPQVFFIPLLSRAISYKRAVGYFSSSSLIQISYGLSKLAERGGKIQIIASPYLSEEDIEAIKLGYLKRDKVIRESLVNSLEDPKNETEKERLNLLANLISDNILDIKIAFTNTVFNIGLYHEKMGIIQDALENKVAFSGSMNESAMAMTSNYEAIDVFCSWNNWESERVVVKENAFNLIWDGLEPKIITQKFTEIDDVIIDKYKYSSTFNSNVDDEFIGEKSTNYRIEYSLNYPTIPDSITLYDYQNEAISQWFNNRFCGVFDMATGTGKTITGLSALTKLATTVSNKLAAVIVCPYQHLVEQWVEDLVKFNISAIVGYSSSFQKNWKKKLEKAIIDQNLGVKRSEFFCLICTNATFSSVFVQEQLNKVKSKKLLLIDEAHNFGAVNLSKYLNSMYDFRLALSATLDRHNDEEGTQKLYDFFGEKCIEYTLERAIKEKKLCRYKYFPEIISLNIEERDAYNNLTYEISKCIIIDKYGKSKLTEKGKYLALERARLIAGARGKIDKLKELIKDYLYRKHILIYCGATKSLKENEDYTSVDDVEIRQIDEVTDILGNSLGMKVSQFTSKESIEERERLKKEFDKGENLQALIAIKCLDEGVNIPNIQVAFILASTTNPKEYIQRRGRVLRLSSNKEYAEIFDFVVLPRDLKEVTYLTQEQLKRDQTLVKKELARAEEFSRLSMNLGASESIIDEIKATYRLDSAYYEETEVL